MTFRSADFVCVCAWSLSCWKALLSGRYMMFSPRILISHSLLSWSSLISRGHLVQSSSNHCVPITVLDNIAALLECVCFSILTKRGHSCPSEQVHSHLISPKKHWIQTNVTIFRAIVFYPISLYYTSCNRAAGIIFVIRSRRHPLQAVLSALAGIHVCLSSDILRHQDNVTKLHTMQSQKFPYQRQSSTMSVVQELDSIKVSVIPSQELLGKPRPWKEAVIWETERGSIKARVSRRGG